VKKKKSLGQHFLKSKAVLTSIRDVSDITAEDIVLEIGPGEGVLTEILLLFAAKIVAIEKDSRLIPYLQNKFSEQIKSGKFELLEKDILDFDPEIFEFYDLPYKVVANIPYYITGQILRMFLQSKKQPESMTLLVQKEVAERIVAKDKKESLLSLSVKIYGEPKIVRVVGRGAFSPQPTVDSAVLSIKNISRKKLLAVKPPNEEKFFKMLRAGFAHKRKQLLPNLCSLYKKDNLIKFFKSCKIDLKTRAEDLPLETWLKLYNTINR
jgi:16S rRNA (adenine1518-N6/adenine1519-N6)-dimethyltransferase